MLWRVREGMQGLLAAMRPPGVTMIIEDVCVPPARIAEGAKDLQALLGKHGFLHGLAGHASAGNLHFLLTPNFGEPADLDRYDAFMHELVELIVDKYDGSLKAEHGTGINMAPFVEREWGTQGHRADVAGQGSSPIRTASSVPGSCSTAIPASICATSSATPEIEEVATKCIECGFCEPVCPSRNVTTTPRQRIVLRREMARQPAGLAGTGGAAASSTTTTAIETCAADGSCTDACPVAIDTGRLIKDLRHASTASAPSASAAGWPQR